jgi:hypothetical protein
MLIESFRGEDSDEAVDRAEGVDEFLPIAAGTNPYEIDTGVVFFYPLVSSYV